MLRRVVFTIDEPISDSNEAIRAVAYPLAEPFAAHLELAVRGTSVVSVAVEVFTVAERLIATATIDYELAAQATGRSVASVPGPRAPRPR